LIYIYAKNYEILKEFLEKLDRDPNFMSFAEISKRKLYVISKLKEKYKFLYKKEEKIIPKRAIDDPKWKEIEKSPRIEWDMVLNTFGTNMVIRILLRRQDYELLRKMIEEKKIFSKDDLNYILESMQKIVEHGDLKPEKMDDYESLKKYIKNLL
jgi:3-polyprenyl-4-hydroxybenzoate decarboxylase